MPIPVKFIKSAVHGVDYPPGDRPEVALAGRSNAGKSSFLNMLTQSRIAKVSQEPGKTRLLNFFDVGRHYRIVDMPGYGYAARAGAEVEDWTTMVENYLTERQNLKGLLLVMDIRRDWTDDEGMLLEYMNRAGHPTKVLLTKIDQLKAQDIERRKKAILQQSGLREVWPISNTKRTGIEEVEESFFREWIHGDIKSRGPK